MLPRVIYLQALMLLGQTLAQEWNGYSNNVVVVTVTNTHYTCPCDGSTNGPTIIVGPTGTSSSTTTTRNTVLPVSTTSSTSTTSLTTNIDNPVSTSLTTSTSSSTTSTSTTTITSSSTTTGSSTTTTTTTTSASLFRLQAAGSTLVPDGRLLNFVADSTYDDGSLVFNAGPTKRNDIMALEQRQVFRPGSLFSVSLAFELIEFLTGFVLAYDPSTTDAAAILVSRDCLSTTGYLACSVSAPVQGTGLTVRCGLATFTYVDPSGRVYIALPRTPSAGSFSPVSLVVQYN